MVSDSTRAISEVVSPFLIVVLVAALVAFIIIALFGYTDLLVQRDLRRLRREKSPEDFLLYRTLVYLPLGQP
jgi:hypothetical protein